MKSWPDPSWAFLGESSQQACLCACSLWCLPDSSIKWLNCFKNNRKKRKKKPGWILLWNPGNSREVGWLWEYSWEQNLSWYLRGIFPWVLYVHFPHVEPCESWPGMQNCCKIYTCCLLRAFAWGIWLGNFFLLHPSLSFTGIKAEPNFSENSEMLQ